MARIYICVDCGTVGSIDTARGRLPERCPDCGRHHQAERERAREARRVRSRTYPPEGRASSALCAGGCGQMLYGSPTSLPPGQRRCRACRAARRLGGFPEKPTKAAPP